MSEIIFLIKHWKLIVISSFSFLFLLLLFLCSSALSGSEEEVINNYFFLPFEENTNFYITSNFGVRVDPINNKIIKFHSGIDLSAPDGTSILASADGVIYKVGFNDIELGNFIYIEHNFGEVKLFTIYAHMLDNSIIVKEGENVTAKQKIGTIGSTGKSTGTHLHFMISRDKVSFQEKDLIDPIIVINNYKSKNS